MAENFKEIWEEFKEKGKQINADAKRDFSAAKSEMSTTIKENKVERQKMSGTKKFIFFILFILCIPLALFGLYLLFVAALLFWDALFGL